jgi:hypothetical protein
MMEEGEDYKYAFTTRSLADDLGGWIVADSLEELRNEWSDNYKEDYGRFNAKKVLIMKPTTSVENAIVYVTGIEAAILYPSISAAINGNNGIFALEWEEDAGTPTKQELQELVQTKDFNRANELLKEVFDSDQDFGYFEGLYEYVSGSMPKEDGAHPGTILEPNSFEKIKALPKDSDYYMKKATSYVFNLKKVPKEFRTPELCKRAVELNGTNIEYVPNKLITPELCKIAVADKARAAIKYVPDKFKTPELYKYAVEQSGFNLKYVPDELKTPELYKIAVENDKNAFKYVPDNIKKQLEQEGII